MGSIMQVLMNKVAPPTTILLLALFLPPYSAVTSLHHHDNLHDKVVLITGASSGIGEHVAYEYARRGARLGLIARRPKRLQAVAAAARHLGSPDVIFLPADVANLHDTKRFIAQTISHFGRLDHLVINAGITPVFMLEEATDVKSLAPAMVQVNLLPVQPVERCARAIVESACRGDKNMAVPSWMKQTVVWKTFFPELLDWLNRLLVLTSPGTPVTAAAGKIILDFTGAKKILYPCSIPSPDLEVD